MIAFLPMYDRPETAGDTDAFWALVREAMGDLGLPAPLTVSRFDDIWQGWTDPDLVLGQTCGPPLATRLQGVVHLVGAPDYRLPGTAPGDYLSLIVCRRTDPRATLAAFAGTRLAVNEPHSQSGWGTACTAAAHAGIRFGTHLLSGAHALSVRAIANNHADIAFIDAHSWRIIRRHDPEATALRILGTTPPTPATPFITARRFDPALVRTALTAAIAAIPMALRERLQLHGIAQPGMEAYRRLPLLPPLS